ncbi:hypothetical protein TUMSATVNIG3_34570 [Vibrio nigripulchritudo]|nr:hypothetical protein TUMSATVNIG3_34570 [Vibrio nigripulchritudo]
MFTLTHRKTKIITTYCGSKIQKTLYQRNPQSFPQMVQNYTAVDNLITSKSNFAFGYVTLEVIKKFTQRTSHNKESNGAV